ncbi:hypothetical protein [Sinorhizobium meliloti]|uniref:hypothetical protein n=1 Tax=Rhizobium meliloti TaxID=382 RepID=UPI0019144CE8|nr:hypothetical protein [Sinorhizobium meliloti]
MAILEAVFADKPGQTPQEVERRRRMAQALIESGAGGKAPSSGLELAGRLAMTLTGQYQAGQAEKQDASNRSSANKALIDAVFGGSQSAPSFASQAAATSPSQSAAPTGSNPYRDAIASIESKGSGDYNAVGPTNAKMGRALGRYQIMEANIAPWSREALGREVSADEFMANPQIQDAVFDHRFGQYVERFGPEGAAQAWFAGPGGVGKTNRKDALGTDVGTYGNKFMSALGPQQVASADPTAAFNAVMPQQAQPAPQTVGAPPVPPNSQPIASSIPQEFAGSQQLANAQGGIIPALMGGSPASPEQVAQARALGAQQPQPQPQGQDNRALIATLLGNPYTAEAGQQLLMQEMQRRQEASDPMRQMEMEKQRLELDALRNPQADPLKVGEGETVIDPRTGQVVYQGQPKAPAKPSAVQEYEYAKEQGFPGTFQDWEASKKGGMSLQVDPATGAVSFQQGGNIKPMTEAQSKDAVFSTRAAGALPLIDQFGDALTGMEGTLGGTVGQLPVVGNFAKTEAFQQAEQAGKEFLQAILRKDTGAAITSEETTEYGSVYLPRPGDSPQLLQQKKASRLRALEAIKAGMPPQAILAQEKALAKTQQGSAPRPPIVIDGYTIEEVE